MRGEEAWIDRRVKTCFVLFRVDEAERVLSTRLAGVASSCHSIDDPDLGESSPPELDDLTDSSYESSTESESDDDLVVDVTAIFQDRCILLFFNLIIFTHSFAIAQYLCRLFANAEQNTAPGVDLMWGKDEWIGRSVRKDFGGYGTFRGRVVDSDENAAKAGQRLFHVVYEDGDDEWIDATELITILTVGP